MTYEYNDSRVCWTHGKVNVCRPGMYFDTATCEWREDDKSLRAVMDYQMELRYDWKD